MEAVHFVSVNVEMVRKLRQFWGVLKGRAAELFPDELLNAPVPRAPFLVSAASSAPAGRRPSHKLNISCGVELLPQVRVLVILAAVGGKHDVDFHHIPVAAELP